MSCKLKQDYFGIRIDKVDQWGGEQISETDS